MGNLLKRMECWSTGVVEYWENQRADDRGQTKQVQGSRFWILGIILLNSVSCLLYSFFHHSNTPSMFLF
jgi:hypothetical protein